MHGSSTVDEPVADHLDALGQCLSQSERGMHESSVRILRSPPRPESVVGQQQTQSS
jgi:hypothetical protein